MKRLDPVWRCYPNGTGVAVIALDPDEAHYVLKRGWVTLEDEQWLVNLDGQSAGKPDKDGRVSVRMIKR